MTTAPTPVSEPTTWTAWMNDKWSSSWWDQYELAVDKYGPGVSADPEAYKARVTETVVHMTQAEQALARFRAMVLDPANKAIVTGRDKANLVVLEKRYNDLAAGMFVDARTVTTSDLGDAGTGVPTGRRVPLLYSSRKSSRKFDKFQDEPPTWPWAERRPYWKDDPYWDEQNQRIDGVEPVIGVAPLIPILVVLGIAFVSIAAIAWALACTAWAAELHSETALQEKDLQARVDASKEGRTLQAATVTPPSSTAGAGTGDKGSGSAMIVGAVAAVAVGALVWYAATQRV